MHRYIVCVCTCIEVKRDGTCTRLTLKVPDKLQLYMDFMCIMWCIFATLAC